MCSSDLSILLLLLRFPWVVTIESISLISMHAIEEQRVFPQHKIIALCNEEWQVKEFEKRGLKAVFVNSNAFVNEDLFRPVDGAVKQFKAVYNAVMSPYKRHELAAKIKNLMVITYIYQGSSNAEYEAKVRNLLASAYWVNDTLKDGEKEIGRAHV